MGAGLTTEQIYHRAYRFVRSARLQKEIDKIEKYLGKKVDVKIKGTDLFLKIDGVTYQIYLGAYRSPGATVLYPVVLRGKKLIMGFKDISAWYPISAYIISDFLNKDIYEVAKRLKRY